MIKEYGIIGAIVGDVIGSSYEFDNTKSIDFELFRAGTEFTDDSILTVATMDVLNKNDINYGYIQAYQNFSKKYPSVYGDGFCKWRDSDDPQPYNSWGNGSAMRVSPVGWAFNSVEEVMAEAKRSAEVTHNHPEGIKGAQATAVAVYMARVGKSKEEIGDFISETFGYDLSRTVSEIRSSHRFNENCQSTVPESIIAFLESSDFENAIRLAVSLGGDSDTITSIAGGIAGAFYKDIPGYIVQKVLEYLPKEFIDIITEFSKFTDLSPVSPGPK
ncbi:MAG: ADP-ribosylglycohydrolase family protein [Fibromonadaceae bacterium]|jgi:ADP-ribosylglycohydrolase|nr:ADP-ribosylglycohydrolase family protein [Fibromonadaceae bacterium]